MQRFKYMADSIGQDPGTASLRNLGILSYLAGFVPGILDENFLNKDMYRISAISESSLKWSAMALILLPDTVAGLLAGLRLP